MCAQMDAFAVESHKRAAKATAAGKFKKEIVPLQGVCIRACVCLRTCLCLCTNTRTTDSWAGAGKDKEGNPVVHDTDEGFRPNVSLESLASLPSIKEQNSKGKFKVSICASARPVTAVVCVQQYVCSSGNHHSRPCEPDLRRCGSDAHLQRGGAWTLSLRT